MHACRSTLEDPTFRGDTPGEVALAQIHAEAPDLHEVADVPAHIADAARGALDKDPAARPSAVELAARLRAVEDPAAGATTVVGPAVTATAAFAPDAAPAVDPTPTPTDPVAAVGPVARSTPRPQRAKGPGPGLVVLGLLLLGALAVGIAYLLADAGDDGSEADLPQAPTASTTPAVATTAPAPATTLPPAPTTTPPTTAPPATTAPPVTTAEPSEDALAGAAVTYIETVAGGDFETAWSLTSPEFQAAQDRASWEGFWSSFDTIELDGDPRVKASEARVDLPLRFDGRNERYRITFVAGPDGTWLVDGPVGR